jgi:F-type H+-transporting ATPase subunit b
MRWFPVLVAVVALLAAADPVLAAAAGGDHPAEEKGGLSFLQLKRYDLGIWTLVVFGLLVLILSKFAFPKISEGLAKREATIIGAKEEATKLRAEAEETRSRLQKEYAEAQDKIRTMIEDARKSAEALHAKRQDEATQDANAKRAAAEREIEAAKAAALQEIYQQAVTLATSLSAKTIRRQLSPDDHRRLLDEALAEMKTGVDRA